MAKIKPFRCIRPNPEVASRVAALPYDVYDRREAAEEVKKEPLSFLAIDRAETQLEDSVDAYSDEVYEKARQLFLARIKDGTFITDEDRCYYIYELVMEGRAQTGIVACASIDDYLEGIIKKHENTREEKEADRIRHVDALSAQTGPIFLAYRANRTLHIIVEEEKKKNPVYCFTAKDGIRHTVWKVGSPSDNAAIQEAFEHIDQIYIADGHHRAASAVKVGLKRRKEQGSYDETEEFNYFLSVLFPDDELRILPYNRVVKDLNGLSKEQFLDALSEKFTVTLLGDKAYSPQRKGTFGMYLEEEWYLLEEKEALRSVQDPVRALDVAILQEHVLAPILGIKDPRTDERIDFIGGIRGLKELERRVHDDSRVAFSMYPTSIGELFAVADAGLLMPPKSTWFEPKLRSGLFIHKI